VESANNSGHVKAKSIIQPTVTDLKANFNLAYVQPLVNTLNLYIDHKWQRSEMEYFQAGPDRKIITATDIFGATIKTVQLPGVDAVGGKEFLKMEVSWAIEKAVQRGPGGEAPQAEYNVKMRDCTNNNFQLDWSVCDASACIKWDALKWESKVKELRRGHTHEVEQHHSQLLYPSLKVTFAVDGNNYDQCEKFMKNQMEGKIQRIEGSLIYKDPALQDIFTATFREGVMEDCTLADAKAGEDILQFTCTVHPEEWDFTTVGM
jgi:hypothetical protein